MAQMVRRPRFEAAPDQQPGRVRRVFGYPAVLVGCLGAAVLLIRLFDVFLPDWAVTMLTDRHRSTYPFTVQNVMWLVFALGVGELIVRGREAAAERAQLDMGYLPEDETTILQAPELRRIYAVAREATRPGAPAQDRLLPRMIQRVVTQYQTNKSLDQANAILTSSLELGLHEIDIRYSMIRYVVWAIPTLGFLGTVIGISLALAYAGSVDLQDPNLLRGLTEQLAVAFDTTLLALMMSAVLVLIQHVVQAYDERALNRAGQYCLDNLINRLYVD